jgi:ribosomal-protein-alanine N-acetyltransferase
MGGAVVIDEMLESDVTDVCAVSAAAFAPATSGAGIVTEQSLREELARPWARVWVAREGGREGDTVGFLLLWHVADEIHVLSVAVLPVARRRGVAMDLMRHALAYAASRKVKHLLLEVRRSNVAAIALYRRLGFYAMGVRPAYYSDGEDAVEMVLLLDEAGRVVEHADEVRLG